MKIKRSAYHLFFIKNTDQTGSLGQMLKGGFINQHASGIYTWLHLGLRSLEKITNVIDEELHKINAIKMLAPICHSANLWKQSQRYEDFGSEMLKMKDRNDREFIFSPTSEELFTHLLSQYPMNQNAYPLILYNNQWKFRDEIRPRYGLVRCREFLMNDSYSFDKDENDALITYQKFFDAYSSIFHRLNLNVCTFSADVGLMGGSVSHEFVIPSDQGESRIECEKWPAQPIQWDERNNAKEGSSEQTYCELGHIYMLGDKYSKSFNIKHPVTKQHLYMGCFGIGISRILGILFEKNNLGVAAPYNKVLITLNGNTEIAHQIYNHHNEICWDDRNETAGVKFAEADLMMPTTQIILGKQEEQNKQITVKQKYEKKIYSYEEYFNIFSN